MIAPLAGGRSDGGEQTRCEQNLSPVPENECTPFMFGLTFFGSVLLKILGIAAEGPARSGLIRILPEEGSLSRG